MIICNTIKGRGIDFMEGEKSWHHGTLTSEQLKESISQLNKNYGRQ